MVVGGRSDAAPALEAPRSGGPVVLAIESSCDETAAAVLTGTHELRSSVVHSQVALHAPYGGVVPELASRNHVAVIRSVIRAALEQAGVGVSDVAGVAVTRGPGLIGSLLVGVEAAKGFAQGLQKPLVGVHHLEGHVCAGQLGVTEESDALQWPAMALLVSGGHTSLVAVHRAGSYETVGRTIDDAAGEAFDKLSKWMGLGYPGGAVIDRLAESGDPSAFVFPRPLLRRDSHDFSFSGVKTAALYALGERVLTLGEQERADVCASYREAICEVLVRKLFRAAEAFGMRHVVVSGGVACNRRLRAMVHEEARRRGWRVSLPPGDLCTDNAAMIGAAAYGRVYRAIVAGAGFEEAQMVPRTSWDLDRLE
mgnify:CR=1 FL=1